MARNSGDVVDRDGVYRCVGCDGELVCWEGEKFPECHWCGCAVTHYDYVRPVYRSARRTAE
jgi:hypothetical protein